jgi:transposase
LNEARKRAVKPSLMNITKNESEVTVGLDLGDRRHAVCVLDAAGKIITEEAIANTRECLTALAQRFPGAAIAMETGTHSPWASHLLVSFFVRSRC